MKKYKKKKYKKKKYKKKKCKKKSIKKYIKRKDLPKFLGKSFFVWIKLRLKI